VELRPSPAGVKIIRETRDAVTLFKPVGAAVHDLAAADRAPGGAQRLGLGVDLWL
jgi:ornithine cyclodeaminase/alanine dehydrogenase-like protein (mu-crystallin family)